jgi:hypothetical protein
MPGAYFYAYFHAQRLLPCPAPISMPGASFHAQSLFLRPFPAPIATTYLHFYPPPPPLKLRTSSWQSTLPKRAGSTLGFRAPFSTLMAVQLGCFCLAHSPNEGIDVLVVKAP